MNHNKDKQKKFLFYPVNTRKDKIKIIRTCLEFIVILLVAGFALKSLFVYKTYKPYDSEDPAVVSGEDHGFIALSYFGVDRTGTDSLISLDRLQEELTALKNLGYVTVSEDDVIAYYAEGKSLPDKSLFLFFEDGRKDTVLFTEKLLEKLNFKASILTYARNFEHDDQKFVSASDLKRLEKEGFWELGTNGYRLSYINTYDRYNRFLGQLDAHEFVELNQYIDRNYNHYLMDYIRDKDQIPVESTAEMTERITRDYDLMEQIYTKEIGYVPQFYTLMHSNTSRFGDNENVSEVNAQNLEGMFRMNMNREGYTLNNRDSSIYDLTRLEPQSWWYTNHLLMRIRDDLPESDKKNIHFIKGDDEEYSRWRIKSGAAEFKKNLIVLTSESESTGFMTLKNKQAENLKLSCRLLGNKVGCQTIYLRTIGEAESADDFESYISVSVENDVLYVREKGSSGEVTLLAQDLYELYNDNPVSVPEDNQDAYVSELKVRGKYSQDNLIAGLYGLKAWKEQQKKVQSVSDGAEEYIPELQINDAGNVKLELILSGNHLNLTVDGITVAENLEVSADGAGGIALESAFGGFMYSQRNIADDVYDAAFQDFSVKSADGSKIIYDYAYHGIALIGHQINVWWNNVVNWFITNL